MEQNLNVIFTLTAISEPVAHAFALPHNREYYIPPPTLRQPDINISSRGTTPLTNLGDDDETPQHILRFTFNQRPKNISKGFVFGSNPRVCDVLLGNPQSGISGSHFCITFDRQARLVVKDSSSLGTAVSYNGQAGRRTRNKTDNFTWILFPYFTTRIIIGDRKKKMRGAPFMECEVDSPRGKSSLTGTYIDLMNAYLLELRNAIPFSLDIHSRDTTAGQSQFNPAAKNYIYVDCEEIGRGEFGIVYRAQDVSTGHIFAAKRFVRAGQKYRQMWDREVSILEQVKNPYIVQFVEHDVEGKWPRLIMEYLPLGNLERQHQEQPISDKETLTILYQGLEALRYLSSRGISHRDLKPENILIYHRSPSCFRIKIGDFGLAKDASILRTTCGTQPYMAPEIWLGNRYTDKVDVWSLGVIVFQYGYGLPDFEDPFDPGNWYQQLRHEVLDWDSDDLIDLISSCMLNMRANERCTASECLEKGTKLWDGVIQSEINYGTPTELMSPANTAGIAKSLDKKLEERPESFEWPTLSSLQPENGAGQFTIQIFDDFDDEAVLYENLTNVEVPTHSSNNLEDMTATGDVNDATSLKPFFGEIGIVPQEGNQILLEDSGCITTKVNGLPVPMHKWDWLINASKLWTAAGKVGSERVTILKKLKQDSKAQGKNEVLWIPLQEAHDLSVSVGIASSLRPLFEYAIKHGAKTPGGFTLEQTIDGQKPETTRSIDKISYYTEMSYSENMCLPVMKGSF